MEKKYIALSDHLRNKLIARYNPYFKGLAADIQFKEEVLLPLVDAKAKVWNHEMSPENFASLVEAAKPSMIAHMAKMAAIKDPDISDLSRQYGETLGIAMIVDTDFKNYMRHHFSEFCHGVGVIGNHIQKIEDPSSPDSTQQIESSCLAPFAKVFTPPSR